MNECLKYVKPSKDYEEKAFEYINEFLQYGSDIYGVGGLNRFMNDYDGWLEKLEKYCNLVPSEEGVPSETFFLVREEDNRIVGMISIRLALNEKLRKFGGNIGYSIRPTERQKGYNKINLYLALCWCKEHGLKEVLLDCDKDNLGSAKTMQALGGKLVKEYFNAEQTQCLVQDYIIDVDMAVEKYKDEYTKYLTKLD